MNKIICFLAILTGLNQTINSQVLSEGKFSYGVLLLAGGRYDNFRRCAATPAGTKGGPIADVMFITRYKLNENHSIVFDLPVMRPLLFGFAFKMLQFEPEFTFEYQKLLNEKLNFITGPGIGLSFHYGPDYKSELKDLKNSFFALGPFFSWNTGLVFKRDSKLKSTAGLKAFYVPLFARDRSTGTVLGGALFYSIYFH